MKPWKVMPLDFARDLALSLSSGVMLANNAMLSEFVLLRVIALL